MNFQEALSFWKSKDIPLTSQLDKLPKYSKSNTTCPSDHKLYSDRSFLDNPISSPLPPQPHVSRRESRPAATAPSATSNILSSPPVIESPLSDQVREQIYSEVASLVSENESRPYYLMELLRAAQLLNTDYLRQTGLNSLKRVINSNLNPDQIDPQAFSSFPAPPRPPLPGTILPDTQLVQEEDVYFLTQNFPLARRFLNTDKIDLQTFMIFPAPPCPFPPDTQLVQEEDLYFLTQNFLLARQFLNTDLSGSSENVDDRCFSRACQMSDAVEQLHAQADIHGVFGGSLESIYESDYSENTTSESEFTGFNLDFYDDSDDEDTFTSPFTLIHPTCSESASDESAVCTVSETVNVCKSSGGRARLRQLYTV